MAQRRDKGVTRDEKSRRKTWKGTSKRPPTPPNHNRKRPAAQRRQTNLKTTLPLARETLGARSLVKRLPHRRSGGRPGSRFWSTGREEGLGAVGVTQATKNTNICNRNFNLWRPTSKEIDCYASGSAPAAGLFLSRRSFFLSIIQNFTPSPHTSRQPNRRRSTRTGNHTAPPTQIMIISGLPK